MASLLAAVVAGGCGAAGTVIRTPATPSASAPTGGTSTPSTTARPTSPAGWSTYEPSAQARAWFPRYPTVRSIPGESPFSGGTSAFTQTDDGIFALMTMTLEDTGSLRIGSEQLLARLQEAWIEQYSLTLRAEQRILLQGRIGRAFVASYAEDGEQYDESLRLVLDQQHLYVLAVARLNTGWDDAGLTTAQKTFFESFSLAGASAAWTNVRSAAGSVDEQVGTNLSITAGWAGFEPFTQSGTGSESIEIPFRRSLTPTSIMTVESASPLSVGVGDDNEQLAPPVLCPVDCRGSFVLNAVPDDFTGTLKVTGASAPWTITVHEIGDARLWDGAGVISGTGNEVLHLTAPLSAPGILRVRYDGSGDFSLTSYSASGRDLLLRGSGPQSVDLLLPNLGPLVLQVEASGTWSLASPASSADTSGS